ncbi:hypothetical protein V1478_010913 [Vespula squamosa]|uniref:Uncharacterized protein n=1 Tax=Vespula squamosa TaxID=30214 RepID=A0ABD2AGB6_VESSQ
MIPRSPYTPLPDNIDTTWSGESADADKFGASDAIKRIIGTTMVAGTQTSRRLLYDVDDDNDNDNDDDDDDDDNDDDEDEDDGKNRSRSNSSSSSSSSSGSGNGSSCRTFRRSNSSSSGSSSSTTIAIAATTAAERYTVVDYPHSRQQRQGRPRARPGATETAIDPTFPRQSIPILEYDLLHGKIKSFLNALKHLSNDFVEVTSDQSPNFVDNLRSLNRTIRTTNILRDLLISD